MRIIIPLIALLLIPPALYAQNGQGYMVINDSIYMQGHLVYVDQECSLQFFNDRFSQNHTVYSCDSVTEFGFSESGLVFHTRKASTGLSSRKMFLKVIEKGEITLYSSPVKGRKFAIESDTIILLEKYTYREQIAHTTPPGFNLQNARYNSRSLGNIVRHYNHGTPVTYYPGVTAGPQLRINHMTINTYTHMGVDIKVPSTFLSAGVFVKLPHSHPAINMLINLGYEPARVEHLYSPPGPLNIIGVNLAQNFLAMELMPSFAPNLGWEFSPHFSAGLSARLPMHGNNRVRVLHSGGQLSVEDVLAHPSLMGGYSISQGFASDASLPLQLDVSWGFSQLWDVSNPQYQVNNFHAALRLSFLLW